MNKSKKVICYGGAFLVRKQVAAFLIIFLIFSTLGISQVSAATVQNYRYTLLVYMNGSDLETDGAIATADLLEMIQGNIKEDMAVIVETGGTNTWHTSEYGLPDVRSTKIERWRITQNSMTALQILPNASMGVADTLSSFIAYGLKNYPSAQNGLILWNHGAGSIYGYGYDELYEGDSLSVEELDLALKTGTQASGKKFDFVGFDACLMGSLEIAEMIAPYSKYLIGSEELEPGHGWNYETVLNLMASELKPDPVTLGKGIINAYYQQSKQFGTSDAITMSLVDLSKIGSLMTAFNNLFTRINTYMLDQTKALEVVRARKQAESYGEGRVDEPGSDMVDLYDFVLQESIATAFPDEVLAVKNAIVSAVLYNKNSLTKPKAQGISFYMPATDLNAMNYANKLYKDMAFSDIYTAFISKYSGLVTGQTSNVNATHDVQDTTSITTPVSGAMIAQDIDGNDQETTLLLSTNVLDQINKIYWVLGFVDVNGDINYLSKDVVAKETYQDGKIVSPLVEKWATVNNQQVALYFSGSDLTTGIVYYYIPAMLNGVDVDIMVSFKKGSLEGTIIGARPYNGDSTTFDRMLWNINPGDVVKFLVEYDREYGNGYVYQGWYELSSITVKEPLTLKWKALPVGNYAYAYEVYDLFNNPEYTSWLIYTYDQEATSELGVMENLFDVLSTGQSLSGSGIHSWQSSANDLPSSWAIPYVDYAYQAELTTQNTLYGFTQNIDRETFSELVVNLYEVITNKEIILSAENMFTDTDSLAVQKAASLGIVNGYGNGIFAPRNDITREQLVVMFYRMLVLLDPTIVNNIYDGLTFIDTNQVSDYALQASEFMVYHQIIGGIGNNKLAPQETSTKEQAIKLVTGLYQYYQLAYN